MKFWKLVVPFTFAAGMAAGFGARGVFDDLAAPAPLEIGDRFRAAVTDVYDADTIYLQHKGESLKARVWGIDAPERSQRCLTRRQVTTCGLAARDELRAQMLDRTASCEVMAFDDNRDRPVVRCTIDGQDPAAQLVREGWAFSDAQYAGDPYRREQEQARNSRRGLWDMEHRNPARWRACQALGRGGDGAIPGDCVKPLGPLNP